MGSYGTLTLNQEHNSSRTKLAN